jgi:Pyruvate/2-oxoacid:ferredoxin oxidoreductase delta subunit
MNLGLCYFWKNVLRMRFTNASVEIKYANITCHRNKTRTKMIHKNTINLHKCINTFACAYFIPGWTASQLKNPIHKTSYGKSCLYFIPALLRQFQNRKFLVQILCRDTCFGLTVEANNVATTDTAPTIIWQPCHGPFIIHVVTAQEIFLHFFKHASVEKAERYNIIWRVTTIAVNALDSFKTVYNSNLIQNLKASKNNNFILL